MTDFPIDAVISWVDGNDPAHKALRYKYSHNGEELKYEDIGSDIRYTSIGEIKYCVASFLKFAPWIRKIYLLTPGQDPHLDDFLNKYFPNRTTQIEIVDQADTFRGYERYLPVFNSLSVETMAWRIPGLSEHYIYSNDDFLISKPVSPEDFFKDGKMVCYYRNYNMRKIKFMRRLRSLKRGHQKIHWRYCMVNAAQIAGEKKTFPHIGHIPMAQMKSLFEEFYATHQKELEANISCRFREIHQYHSQVLSYVLAKQQNKSIFRPIRDYDFFTQPKKHRGKDYIKKKLQKLEAKPGVMFVCFNSLDKACEEDKQRVFDWIHKCLDIAG